MKRGGKILRNSDAKGLPKEVSHHASTSIQEPLLDILDGPYNCEKRVGLLP